MAHERPDPKMQDCIDECKSCHDICLETMVHCLEMGGEHADAALIGVLVDCAEICQTSADFMIRGSDQHVYTCEACAVVCERCATACEAYEDELMKQCAEACRSCAESCREMAKLATAA